MSAKEEGAAILEQLRAMEAAADPGQHLPVDPNGAQKGDPNAKMFPARYLEPDATDDVVKLKNAMASGSRPVPIGDDEIAAYLRKMASHETFKKDAWFHNTWAADSTNPTMQRWAQTMYPEYYRRREQVIDEQTAIQNRIAKMKLYGVRSREDFDLLYGIHQGVVKTDNAAIWDITGKDLSSPKRGLFSPFRANRHRNAGSMYAATPFENFPGEATNTQIGLPPALTPKNMGYK